MNKILSPEAKQQWARLDPAERGNHLIRRIIAVYHQKKQNQFTLFGSHTHLEGRWRQVTYLRKVARKAPPDLQIYGKTLQDSLLERIHFLFPLCVKSDQSYHLFIFCSHQNWQGFSRFIDYQAPIRLIEHLGIPEIREQEKRFLFGSDIVNAGKREAGKKQNRSDYRGTVPVKFRTRMQPGSKLTDKRIFKAEKLPEITFLQGGVRIEKKMSYEYFMKVIDLFHEILGEKESFQEGFEFLRRIHRIDDPILKKKLEQTLLDEIWEAFSQKRSTSLRCCHRKFNEFSRASSFFLKGPGISEKTHTWHAFESASKVIARLQNIAELKGKDKAGFQKALKKIYLGFNQHTFLFLSYFEGEIILQETLGHYFRLGEAWYEMSTDELADCHREFSDLLETCLIKEGETGALPIKWQRDDHQSAGEEKRKEVEAEFNQSILKHPNYFLGDKALAGGKNVNEGLELFDILYVSPDDHLYLYQVKENFNHHMRDASYQTEQAAHALAAAIRNAREKQDDSFFRSWVESLKVKSPEGFEDLKKKVPKGADMVKWIFDLFLKAEVKKIHFVIAVANASATERLLIDELSLKEKITEEELKEICKKPKEVLKFLKDKKYIDPTTHQITSQLLRSSSKQLNEELENVIEDKKQREEFVNQLRKKVISTYSSVVARECLLDVKKKVEGQNFSFNVYQILHANVKPQATHPPRAVILDQLPKVPEEDYPQGVFSSGDTTYELWDVEEDQGLSCLHALCGTLQDDQATYAMKERGRVLREQFVGRLKAKIQNEEILKLLLKYLSNEKIEFLKKYQKFEKDITDFKEKLKKGGREGTIAPKQLQQILTGEKLGLVCIAQSEKVLPILTNRSLKNQLQELKAQKSEEEIKKEVINDYLTQLIDESYPFRELEFEFAQQVYEKRAQLITPLSEKVDSSAVLIYKKVSNDGTERFYRCEKAISTHSNPDELIDDFEKYQKLWLMYEDHLVAKEKKNSTETEWEKLASGKTFQQVVKELCKIDMDDPLKPEELSKKLFPEESFEGLPELPAREEKIEARALCRPLPLSNLGNTCYVNAILQAVLNTPQIAQILSNAQPEKGSLLEVVRYLIQEKNQPAYSELLIKHLRKAIEAAMGTEYEQQDSDEFLKKIFDPLYEQWEKKRGEGILQGMILQRQTTVTTVSDEEHHHAPKDVFSSPFLTIPVTEQKKTLILLTLIQKYFSWEESNDPKNTLEVEDNGLPLVENGQAVRTAQWKKQTLIVSSPPPVIFLHLGRYAFDQETKTDRKITTPIAIDGVILDLSCMFKWQKNVRYRIIQTVSHRGDSLARGHWIAHCKDHTDKINNTFCYCSDSTITPGKPFPYTQGGDADISLIVLQKMD
jgi:ubiquitin C-terminal hydrolase